jgi:ATP-binding cassette subfamily B protein
MSLHAYLDVEEQESRRIEGRSMRRLLGYVWAHPWLLLAGSGMIGLATLGALLEPWLFGYAVDEAILPGRMDVLKWLVVALFIEIALRVGATIAQGYIFELMGQKVTQRMRIQLFSHLHRLPIAIFDKNPAGRLLTRVTNDIASIGEMFSNGFVTIVSNILLVFGILFGLLWLNHRLGLEIAAIFPLLVAVTVYFSRRLKVAYRDARSKLSALNAFLAENLLGMRVVQLFGREKIQTERFDRINQWYADAQVGTIKVFAVFQPTITWAQGIAVSLVIWFGGRGVLHGELKPGVLIAFFSYVLSLFQPMREIADKWNTFLSGVTSAERIFSILGWKTEEELAPTLGEAKPLLPIQGHIEFRNVWFAYEGEHWVLKNFSLELKAGTRVGIVGHTGAGKTTLISLLLRFYEPQRGQILLDGRDLKSYDRATLRRAIGIVQQDVFLFSGTPLDNITFWGEVARRKPDELLTKLGLDPKLASKPIEERASNLSMGERQVMAFARAYVAEPSIWILDEATANMDSGTEAELQRSLDEAARGKTTLLIAHRLSTVRTADRILVLHKGALIEQGSHAELMVVDGLYARLYRYQQASDLASAKEARAQSQNV